jgi:type II secretion system protein C
VRCCHLALVLAAASGGMITAAGAREVSVVPLERVRAASPIQTYRLEAAYHRHLLEVARALAQSEGDAAPGEVRIAGLDEPVRPRLTPDLRDAPREGPPDAAVTVAVYENLAQGYTQRLDPVLRRLRHRWSDDVALVHLDFVHGPHGTSLPAAVAARCAHAQGRFWPYRARLLADLRAQGPETLRRYAEQEGLDTEAFETCVTGAEAAAAVQAQTAAAQAMGITIAPVALVNGRYVEGAEAATVLSELVEAEMGAGNAARGVSPLSALPLDLTGVLVVPDRPAQAVLVSREDGTAMIVTVGDEIPGGARVVSVHRDEIVVERAGARERLVLSGRPPSDPGAEASAVSDRALVTEHVVSLPLAPDLVARIRRERAALERQLTPGDLEVDGTHLLKLTGTDYAAVFERLGLERGDVVMRVNDRWVHEKANRLFATLAQGGPATVVIVRRGIPRLIELHPE